MFNRILKFFGKDESKTVAKNRLQLILFHDRMGVDALTLDKLQSDLIDLLSEYFEINQGEAEIELLKKDEHIAFVANVPILTAKRKFESASF